MSNTDKLEILNEFLNVLIKDLENVGPNFYDLGLDEFGMPNSYGNADDIYSDAYSNGMLEGQYVLAKQLLQLISK